MSGDHHTTADTMQIDTTQADTTQVNGMRWAQS